MIGVKGRRMKAKRVFSAIISGVVLTWLILAGGCGKKNSVNDGGGGKTTDTPPTITWKSLDSTPNGMLYSADFSVKDDKKITDVTISGPKGFNKEWTPMAASFGGGVSDTLTTTKDQVTFTVTAKDDGSHTVSKDFNVTVTKNNTPGTITFSPTSTQNNTDYTATITAQDPDGIKKIILDGFLNKEWNTSGTDVTKTYKDSIRVNGTLPQTKNIRIREIDQKADTTTKNYTLTITKAPDNPTQLSWSGKSSAQNHTIYHFGLSASDKDGIDKIAINGSDGYTKTITGNDTNVQASLQDSIVSATGKKITYTATVTDKNGVQTPFTEQISVTQTPQNTYSLAFNITNKNGGEALDSTLIALRQGTKTIDQATTNEQGTATLHVTQDAGSDEELHHDTHPTRIPEREQEPGCEQQPDHRRTNSPETRLTLKNNNLTVDPADSIKYDAAAQASAGAGGWIKSASVTGTSNGVAIINHNGILYLKGITPGNNNVQEHVTSGANVQRRPVAYR